MKLTALSLTIALVTVLAFITPAAVAQTPPGHWQWVVGTFNDLPSASAALAAGAGDPIQPMLAQTSDPEYPSYVVFRWQFVDVVIYPAEFTFAITNETQAIKNFKEWQSVPHRRIGVVTSGNFAYAVAWYTHE